MLHLQFIQSAKRSGSKLAFIDRSTGRDVAYKQALIGSLLLAKKFRGYGERYIGILLPNSAGCGLAIVAAQMAGAIPVMINYSTGAQANSLFAQEKCGFKTIITSRNLLKKLECPELDGMVFLEDLMAGFNTGQKLLAALQASLPAPLLKALVHRGKPEDTAVIMFTSGSEKAPKAVELTHKGILSNVEGIVERFQITSDDVMLSVLPAFHVFGFTVTLWLPLCLGQSIITYANPLEFKNVARIIRDDKPTLVVGTPYFLLGFLRPSESGDFASIRYLIAGADKTPDALREAYREKHNLDIIEGYGATETSPVIAANPPEANRPGSVGTALKGVEIRIIDLVSGADLPIGQEGKVMVRGDMVMKGYLGDVEETSLRIEDGWYETGDMGVLDKDGYLWHRGRLKRFVKVGGEMVSLVQVESELEKVLPSEIECCAVEIPDSKKGANIVVALTGEVDRKELQNLLAKRLPAVAMPRQYLVFAELPKMGSGKIDFRGTTDLVRQHFEM